MNAALIGLGYWGKTILPIIKNIENSLGFKLEHVCDHNKKNFIDYRSKYPCIEFHYDCIKLLELDLDMVFIATGLHSHYELAELFLNKGCHIFIEKPFVTNVEQAVELNKLAQSKSLTLMIGHRLLYSPSIQYVKNNIFNKSNKNILIQASWLQWGIHQQAGVHWDLASHYLAVFSYLIGVQPKIVALNPLGVSPIGNIENLQLDLDYKHGISVNINVNWNNPYKKKEIVIETSQNIIHINFTGDYPLIIYEITKCNGADSYGKIIRMIEKYSREDMNEMRTIENEFSDFVNSAKTGNEVIASASIASNVVKTLISIDDYSEKKSLL